ncbi:PA14 domain-containing protein [Proteiniphilum sp.]|jgi:beta-galactosidase|uniref:PA14 domain-containing protein n=1 Tax=Proteiniphilum sp. TaxID=1926877 RepID=UPI002B21FA11|nr:PA14 domain-containing protein [Proteiniphilum sp.]
MTTAYSQECHVIDLSGSGWSLWYDAQAEWKNDKIYYDDPNIAELSVRIPTKGWEVLSSGESLPVNVPGTVEEYLQEIPGPEGAIDGVSWWRREIALPDFGKGERVILQFDAIRHRAEVFVNRKLAGYEIVGNSPFEVDITPYGHARQTVELAVRITDPGGNYDWRDSSTFPWNGKRMPPSHAFGGITGNVSLEIQPSVAVTDLYIQSLPEVTAVNAILEVDNRTGQETNHDIEVTITDYSNPSNIIFHTELNDYTIQSGINSLPVYIKVPGAKKWDVDNPNLYVCHLALKKGGEVTHKVEKRFGFRWFEVSGVGTDAIYKLNGRRIVLRSAISWGFWPVNGIYPTDELARRQVMIAKDLGLNMLNFHRAIGNPNVMDYADELGLLIYEEPGGYKTGGSDPFTTYIFREKVLRMVKRDRSHPSLIIYNMMNETGDADPEVLAIQMRDMRDMHRMDPSRIITRTSAWATGDYVEDQTKIHLLPFDTTFYWKGWYDYHHAGGPATWSQQLYQNPADYYNNTTNKTEIVMYGEEGAISSPPRLEKNKADLDKLRYKGWDGMAFLQWYEEFESFIDRKGLRCYYPTVDTLNVAMGRVSFEHQGRKIQMARMNNYTDAYVVNGWESELIENYSGIVDCFRYPKSTPEIIAKYNEPLYVAVMGRKQIVATGDQVVFDFFLINEKDVKGEHTLTVTMYDPEGKEVQRVTLPVRVSGGETYGELLAENIALTTAKIGGMYTVTAELANRKNQKITEGTDQLLVVDLTDNVLAGKGAVWESGDMVRSFLNGKTQNPVEAYASDLGLLDWIIVTRPPTPDAFTLVPADVFTTSDGKPGAEIIYYEDMDFERFVHKERTNVVNHSVVEGATPHETVPTIEKYSMIWKGYITPAESGTYTFDVQTFGRSPFSLSVDGKEILSGTAQAKNSNTDGTIRLEVGKPVLFELKFSHNRGNSRCRLVWTVPTEEFPEVQKMMDRAKNDGTNIFILENIGSWSGIITANSDVVFSEEFTVGSTWLGGVMFNKAHPVFKGLPVNDVLNWPYQAVVRNGTDRTGFIVEGEELLVGAYHTYPMKLGTAMGVVPVGKGKILFSTLDIYDNVIDSMDSSGLVAKKILLNMIDYK